MHRSLYTQALLHKNGSTHTLHTNAFAAAGFYTQKLLPTGVFTQNVRAKAFTHRRFDNQKAFTYRSFYKQMPWRAESFWAQKLLHARNLDETTPVRSATTELHSAIGLRTRSKEPSCCHANAIYRPCCSKTKPRHQSQKCTILKLPREKFCKENDFPNSSEV